ncbi:MAG TPA: TauD/TfdA family dioxygenase [Rhizomicrobium sp.]|nr:TauD/TfdA family dioxygenase [Rhizomicrobium sp.]
MPTRAKYDTVTVTPLTPVIGAEVSGVDLSRPLAAEQLADIRNAFTAHHVLVFRDQKLTREEHKRFGRLFGTLHVHPFHAKNSLPDHAITNAMDPEIHIVKADRNSQHVAGEVWHTDVTCDVEPPMGSMLYITETPEIGGGDTCFLSAIQAYEALSPAMKEIVKTLTATHDGAKLYSGGYGLGRPDGGWPNAVHPVVIRHPDSGKLALFVNRGFTTRINEFSQAESDAFLELLWRHLESHVEFQCRVRWEPGTLTFWDNRVTQHHSVWDYFPYSRYGERVSIVGQRPSL